MIAERTVERLSLYRRLLEQIRADGIETVYSQQLADRVNVTSSQVRRDFMLIGYSGTPNYGYEVARLLESVEEFLDAPAPERIALVGIGNLGRAILAFFHDRRPKLVISAAFDTDPRKVGHMVSGCRCYPLTDLERVIAAEKIRVGIIAVPPGEAQGTAERLVKAGISGILKFTPGAVHVPKGVYVDDMDMTTLLEKVAYFARRR